MSDTTAPQAVQAIEEPAKTIYDELPDAPPKKRLRLSWVGKISVLVVAFWVFIALFGWAIAPYPEDFTFEGRLETANEFKVTAAADSPLKVSEDMVTDDNRTFTRPGEEVYPDYLRMIVEKDGTEIANKQIFGSLGEREVEVPEAGEYTVRVEGYYEFLDPTFMVPSSEIAAYLGSDYTARDVLSRVIWGARTTIGIAFAATLLAYFVGITLGIAAAVAGRWIDAVLSRVVDAILTFPNIMLGLIVIAAFSGQVFIDPITDAIILLVGLAGIVYAASVFRIARALGQDIMFQDYVEAARARGEGLWWIITREVLPNAAMPLATDFGLRLVFVILFISSLSFLGLGVPPPIADWGSMVRENMQGLNNGFFPREGTINAGALASVAPALAIASLTIAINLIVDDISAQSGGSLAKKMV